jgi:hypothetical protein
VISLIDGTLKYDGNEPSHRNCLVCIVTTFSTRDFEIAQEVIRAISSAWACRGCRIPALTGRTTHVDGDARTVADMFLLCSEDLNSRNAYSAQAP